MVVVAALCGLGGGLGAVALRALIHGIQAAFFGPSQELLDVIRDIPWTWRLLAPAVGGLLVGPLVHFVAREAKGHGVPEVMEAIAVRGGAIRPRVVIVKALASAITIGSGGSVGREGPIVQIGSALGSTIGQMLGVSSRQLRTLVGCGAAAGIAAAFNAPIAGALFSVEILLGDFGVPQFSPIVISSVVATVVSRHFLGNFPAFVVPAYELVSPFELLPYMFAGVVAGGVALAFITVLYRAEELFDGLRIPEYLKTPLGGLMVGLIGIGLPEVFGVGYGSINAALTAQLPALMLAVLLVAKILATSITLASGGSGGVFAPSLFLGAMTGGVVGTFVHSLFPAYTATSGAYALVTMGAVVGAATHAPITAIIIIFELTGDYHIIPPLMAACVISSLLATWLSRDSIYTLKLRLKGLDPFKEEDPNPLKTLHVRDVIDRDPDTVDAGARVSEVLDVIVQTDHSELFVVREGKRLVGSVSLAELILEPIVVAEDLADRSRPRVNEDNDLELVMRLFSYRDIAELAVVDAQDPHRLVGCVRRRDVIEARNREVMRRDLAGSMPGTISLVADARQVDVGDGYAVTEVGVPVAFFGRSLRELDLRARYGVEVVFIRSRSRDADDRSHLIVPTADEVLREGDHLIIAGPAEAAARFAAM